MSPRRPHPSARRSPRVGNGARATGLGPPGRAEARARSLRRETTYNTSTVVAPAASEETHAHRSRSNARAPGGGRAGDARSGGDEARPDPASAPGIGGGERGPNAPRLEAPPSRRTLGPKQGSRAGGSSPGRYRERRVRVPRRWGRPNLNRSLLHPKQEGWSKLPHGPTRRRRRADPTRLDNGLPGPTRPA